MRNNGVNKTGQERRIYKICNELSSLGDGAAGDTGGRDGESPLVEEETIVSGRFRVIPETEKVAADEAVGGCTEGESEAEEIVGESTGGSIKDVGEHDVHRVFGSNGAGAEHGEAELHGED